MSKRLQVILADDELREIQRLARPQRTTVAEWVRWALWAMRQRQPSESGEKKSRPYAPRFAMLFPRRISRSC